MIYHFLITQYYRLLFMKTHFYEANFPYCFWTIGRSNSKTYILIFSLYYFMSTVLLHFIHFALIHILNVLTDWNKLETAVAVVLYYRIVWPQSYTKLFFWFQLVSFFTTFLNIHLCMSNIHFFRFDFFFSRTFQFFGVYYCFRGRLSLND